MLKLKKLDDLEKPYAIFTYQVESSAIEQFVTVMSDERIVSGALMPDVHAGYTLPIGGVVAADGWVFPSFVGYDIGCGVLCHSTGFQPNKPITEAVRQRILNEVPVGQRWHEKGMLSHDGALRFLNTHKIKRTDFAEELFLGEALLQLGTLGGGNHCIEIGLDEVGRLHTTIHCGSRNFGHKIASEYMAKAAGTTKPKEGVYGFEIASPEATNYINDMYLAELFASENRISILKKVLTILSEFYESPMPLATGSQLLVDRNHNHAMNSNGLWIHRKGATIAHKGMLGVIPGNMRDGVYLTEGLGNAASLNSSSHGAGRAMSRSKAKDTLSMDEFAASMEGIVAGVTTGALDESPMAYKNFDEVMELQKDLCNVVRHIKPILNVKG